MKLFGFELVRSKDNNQIIAKTALPEPNQTDGSIEIGPYGVGNFYGYGANFEYEAIEDEVSLITKYRELSLQPEFEKAIDDIVNEAFAYDEDTLPVELNLDSVNLSDSIKEKIRTEFEDILMLLDFKNNAYDMFKKWYVDGRLYYQVIIDEKSPKKGILGLKYIDPRKIRKVRKKKVKKPEIEQGIEIGLEFDEYYVYNPKGINHNNITGMNITKDAIVFIHSGVFSRNNKTIYSHLHKGIRLFNILRQLEDSIVIYRLSRAPERRVFNVEVGDLPRQKAEQYLRELIDKFRKKLTYDPLSGEVAEQKRIMSMQEDFWFPKRDGRGTSVDVLQSGQNLGEMEDVDYFRRKLYEALNVPITRLDSSTNFNLGRSSEITRDELKFSKFVTRLRKRFSSLFDGVLGKQLVLKKILSQKEWDDIIADVNYDFKEDNFFTELKWSEILQNRFNNLRDIDSYIGSFLSKKWVQQNILQMTEDEIQEMNEQIEEEKKDGDLDGLDVEGNEDEQKTPNAEIPKDTEEGDQEEEPPPKTEKKKTEFELKDNDKFDFEDE